jgi:glutamyl-tRNA reductase
MEMHLSSASFGYPDVDGTHRAELAERLRGTEPPANAFLLATCLRIEVVVAGSRDDLEQTVAEVFGEPSVISLATVRVDEKAVEHLFRIAAGLESPILGEQEILVQFRQSVQAAREGGVVADGLFSKLLDTAVSVGRQARQLLPESPHDSMAMVAAQVVGGAERVAVLGSGSIARSVVIGLRGLPAPPEVTVVARNPDKVTIDGISVLSFDHAENVLDEFPAVISATSAKQRLISDQRLADVLAARSNPLTLVDMAMPPDFSPPSDSDVRYVDIDDLARMADRRPRRDDADAMVSAAAEDAYRHLSNHVSVGPAIGGLMKTGDGIVERVVDRFAGRLKDADDRAVLEQTAHTVARTLLAGPVAYVKAADRPQEALDVIAEAFGFDEESDGG